MIEIMFTYKNGTMILPINPENLRVNRSSASQVVNIVSLGEVSIPQEPKLATIQINSFFWANKLEKPSKEYKDWFLIWQRSKLPARWTVITSDSANPISYDLQVTCEMFNYDIMAAEEEDIYYELSLREYKPHGAKLVELESTTELTANPSPPDRYDNKPVTPRTYTVVSGDCLWGIAKKFSTKNGADWVELYNITENKEMIGNNPNQLVSGQILILPEIWG